MGASHKWTVCTPEPHIVRLQHAVHSGRVKLVVDDNVVYEQNGSHALWDTGFSHSFHIGQAVCRVEVTSWEYPAKAELVFDGKPVRESDDPQS